LTVKGLGSEKKVVAFAVRDYVFKFLQVVKDRRKTMSPKTKRTIIREIIARAFDLQDDDYRVLNAADSLIEEFPIIRDIDPVSHAVEFAKSKAPAAQLSLEIESALKIQMGLDVTSTKGGIEFVNHAVKKTLEGEHYQKFLDYWKVEGGARKFWSFNKMRENWPAAFMKKSESIPDQVPVELTEDKSQFTPMPDYIRRRIHNANDATA
jgi:hypothetical protein